MERRIYKTDIDWSVENKVLYSICKATFDILYDGRPIGRKFLIQDTGMTEYKIKQAIKILKDKKYIVTKSIKMHDNMPPITGYFITDSAKNTKMYKLAEQEDYLLMQYIFGIEHFPIKYIWIIKICRQ